MEAIIEFGLLVFIIHGIQGHIKMLIVKLKFPVSQRKQILMVFTFQAMIHVLQYFIFQSRLPRISKLTTHHYIPEP